MRVPRLHVITDEVLQDRFDHVELARLAIDGGADAIQYREKRPVRDLQRLRVANALAQLCADAGVQLIIDDRADIASLVGAWVHVGPYDLPAPAASRLVAGVGATANDLQAAMSERVSGAVYLGCGPVFETTSKGRTPPPTLGLHGLQRVTSSVDVPIIAIGGITPFRTRAVLEAGAWGVAVLGGVVLQDDPAEATARYVTALRRGEA